MSVYRINLHRSPMMPIHMKKLITIEAPNEEVRYLNLLFKQIAASFGCEAGLYQSQDMRQLYCSKKCGTGCRAPLILSSFNRHAIKAPRTPDGMLRYLLRYSLFAPTSQERVAAVSMFN